MNAPMPPAMDAAAAPLLDQLRILFAGMDRAWDQAAAASGFACDGCADNCCRTRFYHHTWAEFLLLREAFFALRADERAAARRRAEAVVRVQQRGERSMCPLNVADRCRVYPARPMICRLHGIPSVFQRPDGRRMDAPGCDDFHRRVPEGSAAPLDRTPFYRELARLESDLKTALGRRDRLRMTVAEMVLAFAKEAP